MEADLLQKKVFSEINSFQLKTLSKVWWSIYLTLSMFLICLFTFLLIKIYYSDFWIPALFILPITIALGVLAYQSITNITMRISITNSCIYYKDLLKTKEIDFQNVKGFRVIDPGKAAIGLPGYEVEIESTKGVLITAPKTIENQNLLIELLKAKFVDLNS